MQFHLNGFKPGNPEDLRSERQWPPPEEPTNLPSEVDVLIVGSGPAGLALAAQLSQFPDIKTQLVESKSDRLTLGQADGLQCRTIEMFEAFGFSERVLKEAYWVNETTFWKPDEKQRENIVRSGRIQDTEDGLSEFPHVILNQARVHDFFLDVMRLSPRGLVPDYSCRLVELKSRDLEVRPERNGTKDGQHHFPIEACFERQDSAHTGEIETIRARYLVGCDGARSTVRKHMGLSLHGDSANQAWGVIDVLVITDFPDIRLKTAIHSAEQGSILIIPREGGYMVRLYIELDRLNADERVSTRNITSDVLVSAAKRILHPYTFDVKEVVWWSVYEIGQRLCDRFDDVPEEEKSNRQPRMFLAGDAVHTHSPKAGQGMNVSMADGFNLGWKLAAVLRGQASPQLLYTYSSERQAVAKELIDFDREFARMFSARPKDGKNDDGEGIDPAEFQKFFVKQGHFTAGTATKYKKSTITAEPIHQDLAKGFVVGTRFHSLQAIRLADAKPVQLGHVAKADGRWRIFAFALGDPTSPTSGIASLCRFLSDSPKSPIRSYTPADADVDSVIDLRAVFSTRHQDLQVNAMPAILWPQKGRYGLHDYEKMFCADGGKGRQSIFGVRGIDMRYGCMVVVRPDQYIANVLPLGAHTALAEFFDDFMIEPQGSR